MPLTYTLWRKTCFSRINKKFKNLRNINKEINQIFFQTSERRLLTKFIEKIKREIDGKKVGWRKLLEEDLQLTKINN